MASDQFSLHWDNFHNNMSSGMNSLLENEDLVDVTLAVEGKYLKAHKIVLSVCSPYFKELFKTNPCKHPIVFMKDVSYVALSDLLQFMYQGEVQVSQDNLTAFIKTAEALQIKGLTGDNNGSNDNDVDLQEKPVIPQPTVPLPIQQDYKPIPKQRKVAPAPIAAPAQKRPRLSSEPQLPITKQEPVSGLSSISSNDQIVQFKMEPYDQSQSISIPDDNTDDTFDHDNTLDDTAVDDNEDYSMMEGAEEEPQAGTSADGAGEGQDDDDEADPKYQIKTWKPRKKRTASRMRFVHNGFVYHNNVISGTPPLRYLGCAEHKKSGCRGRATLPLHGTVDQLKMTQPHNHPPDVNAEEKDAFLKGLKKAVRSSSLQYATLKKVYDTIAAVYPKGADEIPFRSICSSLHRWRKNPLIYLRCSSSIKLGCRARAVLDLSNNNTTFYHTHNHPAVLDESIVDIFLKELKLACWERREDHPKVIYEQVALSNPDAAKLKPFQSVRCSLQRWRTMEYVTSLDAVNLKMMRRKPNMPRYIVDGFVFHVNIMKGKPPMIYLRCLEYKRLGCHARAIIPYDGSIQDIKVNKAHNHPPDFAAEEKIVFMRELKEVMLKHPSVPSRTVYSTLSEMYPNAARETPFDSIRHKMSRWRRIKDE